MASDTLDTRTLAADVADALGEGWRYDDSPELADHASRYLDGPDGARLTLREPWNGRGKRVEIAGAFPHGTYRTVYPEPQRHEIGVNPQRGAETIAREITRRLLPDYLPELERVTAKLTEHVDNVNAATALAESLAARLGSAARVSPPDGGGNLTSTHVRLYPDGGGWYGDLKVSPTSVDVSLHGISPERADAILRILADA